MLTLFAQYYVPKDKKRLAEINTCFKKNIENPLVEKFVIFFEDAADQSLIPNYSKLEKKVHPARLTYRDWLIETQGLADGSLSVLVNSDIYLTQTIELLSRQKTQIEDQKRFIALSRHNPTDNGLELNSNPHWTQDIWALVKPKEGFSASLLQEAAIELGQPGCDNKIAYIFHSHGYRVSNPCTQIVAVHLQENTARSYDRKQDKLLGLHAFVHPSDSVTTDSKIELDLLTRSLTEPVEIRVNHWINDKQSYSLNASVSIKEAAFKDASNKLAALTKTSVNETKLSLTKNIQNNVTRSVIDFEKIRPKSIDATKRINDLDLIETHLFDVALYKQEVLFSERFKIYSDDSYYFIYDQLWPYVKKVKRETFAAQLMNKNNNELFIQCFAPTNLSLENIQIGNQLRYQDDILFWQYPCRTEGDASDIHRLLPSIWLKDNEAHIYLPIPWATFIDKKKFPIAFLGLLGKRIEGLKSYLASSNIKLRVHSVCQHIHFKRDLPAYLSELGVTDLWTSHKRHGVDLLGDEVQLHSWPLYAVNYKSSERSVGLTKKSLVDKKYLASFVGAYMDHYLSDIRLKLRTFSALPDFCIEINNQWHFNKVVYEHQVSGKSLDERDDEKQEVLHYNKVLSDSIFSLCPSGAGPNSLRLWESLAIGSIPVILSDDYELPDISHLTQGMDLSWKDAVITFPEGDIDNLEQYLRAIPNAQREKMSAAGMQIYGLIESLTCFGNIPK